MEKNKLTLQHPEFKSFYKMNPDFDILKFNFLDTESAALLNTKGLLKGTGLKKLMAYQRVLRLYPDVNVANELISDQLDSSIKITNMGQTTFVKTYGTRFGDDGAQIAGQLYGSALHCKSRVMHLVASVKSIAASPNFSTMLFNPVDDSLGKTFQDMASYQDYFGSLDYCECEECNSIFGAAAYLVDLLSIIEKGITRANPDIADGLRLFDRRPDLEKIELTCENTNTLIPYLQIVNNLLANTLKDALTQSNSLIGGDVYLTLANSYFPFNLPFNLPLQQMQAVLGNQNLALSDVSAVLSKDNILTVDQAGKILMLSVETLNNLKKPDPANLAAVESANYGLTLTANDLKGLDRVDVYLKQSSLLLAGLKDALTQNLSAKEIFDVTGNYTPSMFGPTLTLDQQGSDVTGTYATDGHIRGTMDGQVMRGQWTSATQFADFTKGDIEFTFSDDGTSFTGKWSKGLGMPWELTAWNGTLNGTSTQGIIPHSLYINAPLAAKKYLKIVSNVTGDTIALQNLDTLDHMNRFIRLSALMGWTYVDTNWVLTTLLGANDISDGTFIELAKVKECMEQFGPDLGLLTCMWFDIRTIGMGKGPLSEAPFDQLFNSPAILQQTGKFYRPLIATATTSFVNPLYTDQPVLFVVDQELYDKSNPTDPTKLLVAQGQVIIRGIPTSQDNIRAIALAIFGQVATIQLTVSNLSALYRHIMLAKQLNTTIDRYVLLLKLLGYTLSGQPAQIQPVLDRDAVLRIINTANSIKYTGFTVYDIDYLVNQKNGVLISPYVNNGYRISAVPEFLKTLRVLLTASACLPDSFAANTITAEDSAQLFQSLVSLGYIDTYGLVVKDSSGLTAANWASIYIGTLIQKDDFIGSLLTTEESEQVYAALQTQKIISDKGRILTDPSKTDWTKILIGNPLVPIDAAQQAAVLAIMLSMQSLTDSDQQAFVVSQLSTLQSHQSDVFSNQIGAFFSVKDSTASLAIDAVKGADLAYLEPFIASPDAVSTEKAETFLLNVSKILMLQRIPGLTDEQLSSICFSPAAYGLVGNNTYTYTAVLTVANLKPVVQSLGDTDNKLIEYFGQVWAAIPPPVTVLQDELCALTGWNKQQYLNVVKIVLNNPEGCKTLGEVIAVKSVFDLANTLGIDTYFLQAINQTSSLPATITNWPVYNDVASKLLLTLQATTSSEAIQDQYRAINAEIEGEKRDAMLHFSISVLGKIWEDIKTPNNLYEFLLIDPETGGCSDISLIEEAINAAQLYLQRCRLNLEKDIHISPLDIPHVWWEWMMSYRVWEANRKIFVYPENYIDPRLRKSKTSLFDDLENTLMQGEVTTGLVETAYVKYLDDFSVFAKLRYVDAYQTIVIDKERGPIDTLFLFARTQEQPYHFFYITRETVGNCSGGAQYQWTEWKNINIKIDARHVTPVYAFNKLFVFWVELTNIKDSAGLTGETGDKTSITTHSNIITKASIKYSYYNFNEQWVQPQTLVADKVVNVLSVETAIYGSFAKEFKNKDAACWTRVSVINTQADNYIGNTKAPDEKLIVYFGPLGTYGNLDKIPAIPNLVNDSTAVYAFKDMLKNDYFNLQQMDYFNLKGYIPLCGHYVVDEVLTNQIILNQNEYLVLASNTLSTFMPPTFTASISDTCLVAQTNYSSIVANNCNGIDNGYTELLTGPQVVTDSSFVIEPYINFVQSQYIRSQILKNMPGIIDGNNQITKAALSLSVSSISSELLISEDHAVLVQNQFYNLYYGSLVLFSNLSYNAEVVPVKNQPNTFILDNNDEAFLVTAINNVVETELTVLNGDSFVSATINKSQSENYFVILSTDPNNYIFPNGTVNNALLKNATAFSISKLLAVPLDDGTAIYDTLTVAGQATQKVVVKDYDKIDQQIRITATLTPDCFVSLSVTEDQSETYFNILSTPPNAYILADGSVNFTLVKGVTTFAIGHLIGLAPTDPTVINIVAVLKSAASIITQDSFVTLAVDPGTNQPYITPAQSATYFGILSTAPNNYILANGLVNQKLMENVTVFSIGALLSLQPYSFAVASVISVLSSYAPVALGYVYPNEPDSAPGKLIQYDQDNIYSLQFKVERLSTGAINSISQAMTFGGIDAALALDIQQPPVTIKKPFSNLEPNTSLLAAPLTGPVVIQPSIIANQEVDFTGPYGMYYWELFFHTPFLVAAMLNSNQRFEDAESWLQYIFNPTMQNKYLTVDVFVAKRPRDISASVMEGFYPILQTPPNQYIDDKGRVTSLVLNTSPYALSLLLALPLDQATEVLNLLNNYYVNKPEVRAWQFDPFRNYTLQTLLQNLSSCAQIAVYNDDPFDPDAIARLRIGAYEKTIMMKYIDNLLDWGDFEFAQYSWESITMARMYYGYASDLLGPRPVDVGICEVPFPVTFQDIAAKYKDGDIPQFLIDMEHLSAVGPIQPVAGDPAKPFNDLGFYFGVPDNEDLSAYWDRIEDRLYKIRHCLNIDGVAKPLPLFQPPLNPMDLVRASAQGGNVLGVASQQQQNISYYRFTYLIDRARAYTELVSEFGSGLLSALEKSDAEALSVLSLNQSKTILNMTMVIKNQQLEGLQNQLSGMEESLQSAQNRNLFYTTMIDAGFNAAENSALAFMQSSIEVQEVMAGIQGVSIAGYLAPCIFGFSDGGMKFGDAINMGAQMLQTTSQILSQQGSSAETIGQFQRRAEDWQLQQQTAQFDINQIQDQILSLQTNITSSQQEIEIQKKSIEQNQDLISFYQNKFTNQELYQWMISRLSAVYFQAYKLALDTALTAQMSYQYELDRNDAYITFGYWDSLHKGLLAADGLKLSIAQLDNAYTENNKRRMEIEKTISLKSLNPEAFYAFLSGSNRGTLMFSLTEELYDRDFPSHYCRRIKSVSVSIPAVIGPYQNIHATLTQNTNLVVLIPDKEVVNYVIYQTAPQKSGTAPATPAANALRQNWASSQQIALSKGVDDSGVFALNFDDPRYLPFEATGAVSSWTLSMPPATNQIDFASISDVILSVKYTAKDGGSSFGQDVTGLYSGSDKQYQNIRITSFNLAQAFANNWYQLFQTPPDVNKQQKLTFPIAYNMVLPNLKNVQLNQIIIDLGTAPGAVVSSNTNGLLLKVGNVTVPVSIQNNQGTVSDADLATITQWLGLDWSLIFVTDKLPQLCSNNQLDPAKLIEAILFVGYTSDI